MKSCRVIGIYIYLWNIYLSIYLSYTYVFHLLFQLRSVFHLLCSKC